jgi:glycosyltransferase involved in cell wall biosynthesis
MSKDARPLVSVVLPVYNAAASLDAALESLLHQVDLPGDFEIVAVDGGSSDESADILAQYAARDPRLRLIRREHQGVTATANVAMSAARGRFIARMDADDVCSPDRLAKQSRYLLEHPEVGVVSCRIRFGGDAEACAGYARHVDWVNEITCHEDICLSRFVESPICNPSVMFRAELLELHGDYLHGDFPEDYELWLRWLAAGVRMEKLPDTLLTWNDPPTRLTRNDPRYDMDAFYRVKAAYLADWLEQHNPRHPEIVLIGSGRVTRRRAEMLTARGVRITAYVDVDPRKIGNVIAGVPVLDRKSLPEPGECFVVSYVGGRDVRGEIEDFLLEKGFVVGEGCIFAA